MDVLAFLDRDQLDAIALSSRVLSTTLVQNLDGKCLRNLAVLAVDGTAPNGGGIFNVIAAHFDGRNRHTSTANVADLVGFVAAFCRNSYVERIRIRYSMPAAFFQSLKVQRLFVLL